MGADHVKYFLTVKLLINDDVYSRYIPPAQNCVDQSFLFVFMPNLPSLEIWLKIDFFPLDFINQRGDIYGLFALEPFP